MKKLLLATVALIGVLALACTSWAIMNVYDSNGNFVGSINIEAGDLGRIEFSNSGGGGEGDVKWGAYNGLCCTKGGSLKFAVTIDGATMYSTTTSCDGSPSWEGYTSTSSGSKSLSFVLSGCGSADGSGSVAFESGKCYIVISDIEGSDIVIKYGEDTSCSGPSSSGVSLEDRLEIQGTIRLFIGDGQLQALGKAN